MTRRSRLAIAVVCSLLVVQGASALAQWGYPMGMGGFGWEGWGVGTFQGDVARGMGMFAKGAGVYNKKTAIADQINTDTVMRWNQFIHESQMNANQQRQERMARQRARNIELNESIQKRLRDNPEPRDIFQGSALNVALDEINDPRVYTKALQNAKVRIGGEKIRIIPFRYAAAAITVGLHQIATGALPAALRTPEFEADREALKALDQRITQQIDDDKQPDPATVQELLGVIFAAEEKVARSLPVNSLERRQAEKYLKAIHGLVVMLKVPALDDYLAGVEKRPDATLGELLNFMRSFNLRFGPATTIQQRDVYSTLYPKLVKLRDEVAPALTSSPVHAAAEDFFTGMSFDDLEKNAPKPRAAAVLPR